MKQSRFIGVIGIAFIGIIALESIYFLFVKSRTESILNANMILDVCSGSNSLISCWSDAVDHMMEQRGVGAAFELVAKLYDTEPKFAQGCHSFTHKIGTETYKRFVDKQRIDISPKTAYCGYGFYHGFMEALLQDSGDFEQARKFCAFIDQQLRTLTPDAGLQCYHGIGHGTVNDHNRKDWGNERALIDPAMIICENLSQHTLQLSRCASGVFNGLALFYIEGEYGLTIKSDDPLWICREQKKEYQEACYGNMNVALLWLTKQDFFVAARFIEHIISDDQAIKAIRYLAAPLGSRQQNQQIFSSGIHACHSLQSRLRLPCIQGFAFGMLEHGPPGNEYINPLKFCDSSELEKLEQKACFDYIFSYLGIWYSREKAEQICVQAVSSQKDYCFHIIRQTIKERSY